MPEEDDFATTVLEVLETVTELVVELEDPDTTVLEVAEVDVEEEDPLLKADLMASKFFPVNDLGTGLWVLMAVTEVFLGLGVPLPLSKIEIRSEIGFLLARIDMLPVSNFNFQSRAVCCFGERLFTARK